MFRAPDVPPLPAEGAEERIHDAGEIFSRVKQPRLKRLIIELDRIAVRREHLPVLQTGEGGPHRRRLMGETIVAAVGKLRHEERLAEHPRRRRTAKVVVEERKRTGLTYCRHRPLEPRTVVKTLAVVRGIERSLPRMGEIGVHRHRVEISAGIPFEIAHEHIPVGDESLKSGLLHHAEVEGVHRGDFAAQKLPGGRTVGSVGAQQLPAEFRHRRRIGGIPVSAPLRREKRAFSPFIEVEKMLLFVEEGDADQLRIVDQRLPGVGIRALEQKVECRLPVVPIAGIVKQPEPGIGGIV